MSLEELRTKSTGWFQSVRNRPIQYVSGGCGSLKTTRACEYIRDSLKSPDCLNYLMAFPHYKLLHEAEDRLKGYGVNPVVITGESRPDELVSRAIMQFLSTAPSNGTVLLITQQALLNLPWFPRQNSWQCIIDEIPKADCWHHVFFLPREHHWLADQLEAVAWPNRNVMWASPKDKGAMKRRLEGAQDDKETPEEFRELMKELLSPNKQVFMTASDWHKLSTGQGFDLKDDAPNALTFVSLLRPEAFRNAIIMGANFEKSLLYILLTRIYKKRLEVHEPISSGLRLFPPVGRSLRLLYIWGNKKYSKRLRNEDENFAKETDAVSRYFGEEAFLTVPNGDSRKRLTNLGLGEVIDPDSRGLNRYQEARNIYFAAAIKRQPNLCNLMCLLGFTKNELDMSTCVESAYQAIYRTALRRPEFYKGDLGLVTAIVPDRFTAEAIAKITGCEWVERLDSSVVDPKPIARLTRSQERQRQTARHQQDQLLAPKKPGISISLIDQTGLFGVASGSDQGSGSGQDGCGSGSTLLVTFHKDPWAKLPSEFQEHSFSTQDFIEVLRQSSRVHWDAKTELYLFNPAVFSMPDGQAEGYRRQANFIQSSALVLDFDNGELSPEQFEAIIDPPTKSGSRSEGLSFLIYNSFSRSPEQPNRFRVIVFYSEPARSLAAHQGTYDEVVRRLAEAGYPPELSGLDANCRSGVHSFWMPATNREFPEWAFFRPHNTKTRELRRHNMNPNDYIAEEEPAAAYVSGRQCGANAPTQAQIDAILGPVRSLTSGRERPWRNAGLRLHSLGLTIAEIEAQWRPWCCDRQSRKKLDGVIRLLRKNENAQSARHAQYIEQHGPLHAQPS